jgi:hypothetical protein
MISFVPREAVFVETQLPKHDETELEPSFREVAIVSVAALFPPFIFWLIAVSSSTSPIIRFALGVLGFWPWTTLGLVFAALSFTSYVSTIRRWLVYAAGFSIVALVSVIYLEATATVPPSSQHFPLWPILAVLVISIAPSAVSRTIYSCLRRRWLAVEYAVVTCFITTMWAVILVPPVFGDWP